MTAEVNYFSGGGGGKVYEEDITGSQLSSEYTVNCGFEPKIIMLYDSTNSTYPFIWGYNKDGFYGNSTYDGFCIDGISNGALVAQVSGTTYQNRASGRGGLKSVNSTGCVIGSAGAAYQTARHIIIYG